MPSSRLPLPFALLLIVLLGSLLYFPSFAADELDDEEGRRAIPAREILASGDYIVPTIWERPYLAKPPLFFWSVAAASNLTGGVNEAATRLPSIVATLLTAVLLLFAGRAWLGPPGGLVASVLFLVTACALEKGAFGELEAMLTLTVTATILGVAGLCGVGASENPHSAEDSSASGRTARTALLWAPFTGVALAAALLTKGPPAFVFFGAAAIAAIRSSRGAKNRVAFVWILSALLQGVAFAGIWVALLFADDRTRNALDIWKGEVSRSNGSGLSGYFAGVLDVGTGLLAGFLPGSLVLLACLRTRALRTVLASSVGRFLATTLVLSVVFFLFAPGSRPRYAYPIAPTLCLLTAPLIAGLFTSRFESDERVALARRVRLVTGFVGLLGLVLAGAALSLNIRPMAFDGGSVLVRPFGGWGTALTILMGLAGAWALFGRGTRSALISVVAAAAVLMLAREVQLTQVLPQLSGARRRAQDAAAIESLFRSEPAESGAPRGSGRLRIASWDEFNVLFYLTEPPLWIEDVATAEIGERLLIRDTLVPEINGRNEFELLGTVATRDGFHLSVVERVRVE